MADLSLRINAGLRAFAVDVELTAGPGTLALVGPSGAGKTTVLRCVAGLRQPDGGRIALGEEVWFDSERGVNVAPEHRSVGLVPQHYALFPHMTVRQNVAFGASRGDPQSATFGGVDDLLARLHIAQLAGERPGRLSGGERQRVALARALARQPSVLALDEPLAALDAQTRTHVRTELAEQLAALALPTLLVTHDFRDAAALADRVAVLLDGRVHQYGTVAELLAHPADAFVASFTGANVLHGNASGRDVVLDDGTTIVAAEPAQGRVAIALQPWEVTVATAARDGLNAVPGVVESCTPAGGRVRIRIAGIEAEADAPLERGTRAYALFAPETARVMRPPTAAGPPAPAP